jgi:hypothetical protein
MCVVRSLDVDDLICHMTGLSPLCLLRVPNPLHHRYIMNIVGNSCCRVKRMALRPALWNLVTVPHLLCFVLALYPNWILLRKFAYSHLGLLVNVMAWPTPFFAFLLFRLSRISCTRDAGIATATEYKSD